ncbi:MAG: hypothetical protein IKF09_05095 [Clostridiales bacterium]|nr:hypothetical protein [Clostridiales bacterium]
MTKGSKTALILILSLVLMLGFVSCVVKSKVNENAAPAPLTSEWTYDHATRDGENVPRYLGDKDEELPHFWSDGETFKFNITPGKEYTGTVVNEGDNNYRLYRNGEEMYIKASITGNSLTLKVGKNNTVVFVTK